MARNLGHKKVVFKEEGDRHVKTITGIVVENDKGDYEIDPVGNGNPDDLVIISHKTFIAIKKPNGGRN